MLEKRAACVSLEFIDLIVQNLVIQMSYSASAYKATGSWKTGNTRVRGKRTSKHIKGHLYSFLICFDRTFIAQSFKSCFHTFLSSCLWLNLLPFLSNFPCLYQLNSSASEKHYLRTNPALRYDTDFEWDLTLGRSHTYRIHITNTLFTLIFTPTDILV